MGALGRLALTLSLALAPALIRPPEAVAQQGQKAQPAQKPQQAQPAQFSHPIVTQDAARIERQIKAQAAASAVASRQTPAQLRQAAQKLVEASDPRGGARLYMQAVHLDPKHAATWLQLARAILAITPDESKGEQHDYPAYASGAALRAYETAATPAAKSEALVVMVEGLKTRSLWRPALEALRTAVALNETPELRATYEALRAEHGFRMVDYKIDTDTAEPRACLNFSERIAAGTDLAKFVSVDGRDPQNVSGEGRQLCVEGLAHGKRYVLQVRSGLPADTTDKLQKPAEIAIYVRDRTPSVRFTGRAYVLPSRGQQGIPVVTVNASKVAVEIYRIGDRGLAGAATGDNFLKQLQSYELSTIRERAGQRVFSGELEIPKERLNEDVTTALPVGDAVKQLQPGVYILTARIPRKTDPDDDDNGPSRAAQWFIVSDLGLTALSGEDGLHGFVRSLASAAPASGVTVRLVAKNNEVLGSAKTDAAGYVRFDVGLKRGDGGMAPALLIAETAADYSFLDLAAAAFDLTDRGVKGRDAPGALDAFLFAERGVYRPGEAVHLTGLVRDRQGRAATLPMTLILSRPDGVEHRRVALPDQGLGGRSLSHALAPTAMTGTWRAKLYADPKADPVAQTSFLVEDFVPERLDLTLEPGAKSLAIETATPLKVAGRFLYGLPAANLEMEGEIVVRPATGDLEGFAGYRFGLADERITAVRKPLDGLPSTDANGRAEIPVRLPAIPRTARLLEADVLVRLKEPGGRTIERKATLPVSTGEARIGVKPLFANSTVGEGQDAEFEIILVSANGKPMPAKELKWELSRLETRWQWYQRDGQWSFDAVNIPRRLQQGTVATDGTKAARVAAKIEWGRYRLDVTAPSVAGAAASVNFQSGWHPSEQADNPETLDIALDKPAYKGGDTARLRIASRERGRAQIAVLSSGLLHTREVDVPAGGTEVAIEVKDAWLPGAYVTATLYRALDEGNKRMPGRAIGVAWLGLDTSGHTLKVALDAPQKIRPATKLAVPVKLGGIAAGEEARVTVAAVDVGILNLTRYEAPAPEKWFLAQRKLGTEIRDFYGRLIDGMRAERGRLRAGGDGGGGMSLKGSPPVEAPLALYSGIVKVGPDGSAKVELDIPDFNGTVRLMAVAWSAGKVGSGQADVIVRDQLALTATAPRFLHLGDEARLDIDVHNVEGPKAAYKIALAEEAPGGLQTSLPDRSMALDPGQRRREAVPLKPVALGRTVYDVRVSGPGGIEVRRRIALDVKPPANDIRRTTIASLAAKDGKLSASKDLLADLIPSSTRVSMMVGPTAALDVASLLTQLDRYPYGCAEQTTSRALPLLYVSDLAKRLRIADDGDLKPRIAKAIDRVLEMQASNGAFGIWGPDDGSDIWLTAYVTDFLTRAKETGHTVPQLQFSQALDRLANALGQDKEFKTGGEARAYALYVLARNSRAPVGELRYDVDTRLDRFATPLAQAQLGAALAMLGEKERAERAFKAASARVDAAAAKAEVTLARADYGSLVRDSAALVTLASETGVLKAETPSLAGVLGRVYRARTYSSTQEQAWMLLAARALAEQARTTTLTVNGAAHQGELMRTITAAELEAGPVTVINTSEAPVDAMVSAIGASLSPEPAIAKGFKLERSYYTLEGKKVDLKSAEGGAATLAQNDRLVVVLKITGEDAGGRVLVVDRLPAGLEIENPRLVAGGSLKGLDLPANPREPDHTEFRDDRFVASFNFFGGERPAGQPGIAAAATVAYVVRAVTPGSYAHPAATVEDMYRPERFARTAAGRLTVTGK